ncbi:FUSC family protein [Streptomyces sp. NPDC001970]
MSRSSSAPTPTSQTHRIRRLPLAGALRLGAPSDIWFKPSTSVVVSTAMPNVTLLLLGRLDLVLYTMAGSLCALFAHNVPYAARARTLARVVLGMLAGVAVALVTASLTHSAVVLVTVGALLAAAQKALCDASRIGPPGNIIFTFISSASLFTPQTLGQVPGHLALAAGAGAVAWLVGMAPVLVRPHGPERRATARALNAAAAYAATRGTGPDHERARAGAAGAVHAAWQCLLSAGARNPVRHSLERLVVRAEVTLAAPAATDPAQLRAWAHELRGNRPVPHPVGLDRGDADELLGVRAGLEAPGRPLWRLIGPGSLLLPIALRTAVGCALAGYVSLALGIGLPFWALVTAASLYQANMTLSWSRGVQRVVGNLAGVLVFALIAPLAHLNQAALVVCCLACNFVAEALAARNYWLCSVFVTPMALMITEFAHFQQPGELILDRVVDTLTGAAVGIVAALAVTNRRVGDQLQRALDTIDAARDRAESVLAADRPDPRALETARRRLTAALVELRAGADAAAGEWWQRALPEERLVRTERAGHRTLAATIRRQGLHSGERLNVEGARA